MFFFGIFGIQNKEKNLKEFSNIICSCGMYSRMQLVERYYYLNGEESIILKQDAAAGCLRFQGIILKRF